MVDVTAVEVSADSAIRRRRRGKVRAILAGCAVVGVGAAVTLAAWTDTEWVWGGGTGDDAPIGTSSFNVQQNTFPANNSVAVWTDEPDSPGGQLRFQPGATAITPGSVISAPMQLRTAAGSDAASVSLVGATQNGSDTALFNAMTYGVYTGVTDVQCRAGDVLTAVQLVAPGSLLTVNGSAPFTLAADMANAVTPLPAMNLCFVITLPDIPANQALQGQQVSPAWEFAADSVTP